MWYFCASLLCLQLAAHNADLPHPTATAQFTVAHTLSWQTPPESSEDSVEPPPDADEQGGSPPGARKSGARRGGPRMMAPGREEEATLSLTGPMRLELFSIDESRVRQLGDVPPKGLKPGLQLFAGLTGERLGEVVGMGPLVIAEMTDDAGDVLAAPDAVTEEQRTETRPIRMAPQSLARGYMPMLARVALPKRAATKIVKIKGWLNVVYGKDTEDIMIDNPLQYRGGYLENPRLAELGLKIRVVEPVGQVGDPREGHGIALQFEGDTEKHLRRVELFDAWLKPMYPREHPATTADGKACNYYGVAVGQVDADTQMLLKVYPKVEDGQITFEFKDIELP